MNLIKTKRGGVELNVYQKKEGVSRERGNIESLSRYLCRSKKKKKKKGLGQEDSVQSLNNQV